MEKNMFDVTDGASMGKNLFIMIAIGLFGVGVLYWINPAMTSSMIQSEFDVAQPIQLIQLSMGYWLVLLFIGLSSYICLVPICEYACQEMCGYGSDMSEGLMAGFLTIMGGALMMLPGMYYAGTTKMPMVVFFASVLMYAIVSGTVSQLIDRKNHAQQLGLVVLLIVCILAACFGERLINYVTVNLAVYAVFMFLFWLNKFFAFKNEFAYKKNW